MKIEDLDTFWIDKSRYDKAEAQYFEGCSEKQSASLPPIFKKASRRRMELQQNANLLNDVLYMNPLTIEAHFFLETLESLSIHQSTQLDPQLTKLLERIVIGIEEYLKKTSTYILPTERVRCVPSNEILNIKRTFTCILCKNRCLGNTISKAVAHLTEQHANKNGPAQEKMHTKEGRPKANIILPKKTKALISNEMSTMLTQSYQVAEKLKIIPEYDVIELDLSKVIRLVFPEKSVRVYKFGSRLTGTGTRSSDLDIFVDIENTFHKFEHRASKETIAKLLTVQKALANSKNWRIINVIENARVPIIKACHLASGIECDIGFSNSLGFCNTNLIKYIFEIQPVAQYMCIFLKKWLERSKLTEQISTYTMTLLVIYFLQLRKLLPSIELLQTDIVSLQLVGPWVANFTQKSLTDVGVQYVEVSTGLLKEYLKSFFDYYAVFNYDKNMVCPYFGLDCIDIMQVEHSLPKRYDEFVSNNSEYALQLHRPMVVQDPIQLNHNVTKAVTKYGLKLFVEYSRQTAELFGGRCNTGWREANA